MTVDMWTMLPFPQFLCGGCPKLAFENVNLLIFKQNIQLQILYTGQRNNGRYFGTEDIIMYCFKQIMQRNF